MMGSMAGILYVTILLATSLLLGFAYIIWVLSSKESGNAKLMGQIVSVAIIALTVISLGYGLYAGATMGRMMGRHKMMGGEGMKMGKDMKAKMEMMKKNPEMMKKMMEECGAKKK